MKVHLRARIVNIVKAAISINWIATVALYFRFPQAGRGIRFFAMRGSRVIISSSASATFLPGAGLWVNSAWALNNPFKSHFVMRQGSQLVVKGDFRFYAGSAVFINSDAKLILGANSYVNMFASISCFGKIEIGSNVVVSERVTLRDSDNHSPAGGDVKCMPIVIEDDVWIGLNVTILKGVRIGRGAIVAAGALVNRDVPAHSLVAGVPAKVVRMNVHWK